MKIFGRPLEDYSEPPKEIEEVKEEEPEKKEKTLDELIEDALKDAPPIEGYTKEQLEKIVNEPYKGPNHPGSFEIGRSKIYGLKEKEAISSLSDLSDLQV